MPSAGLFGVIDDIASVLDDVALLTKVASKKTAGVLGDDLALNAEQVAGVRADRELPVVWSVAKGSLVNKAILVPAALAISAVAPWLITPLLVIGGTFLCFEGCEKLAHKFLHQGAHEDEQARHVTAVADPNVDLVSFERAKVKGAIRTDFVLSAEIVVIALGTVATAPFATRVAVLVSLSVLMTAGVYGLVAGIVKLDDLGRHLAAGSAGPRSPRARLGGAILRVAPWLMKALSVAGTLAMFLVGGGILTHAAPGLHDFVHHKTAALGPLLAWLVPTIVDLVAGLVAGSLALALWTLILRFRSKKAAR